MKVLILGMGRSGTTSLYSSFTEQDFFGIIEPFSPAIWNKNKYEYPFKELETKKNIIVKFLLFQKPKSWKGSWDEFVLDLISRFDKVILLDRKDFDEHVISMTNLWYRYDISTDIIKSLFQPWCESEIPLKFKENFKRNGGVDRLMTAKKELLRISNLLNIDITWYEDLYSNDRILSKKIIESWGINDINVEQMNYYLNPKHKLKKAETLL